METLKKTTTRNYFSDSLGFGVNAVFTKGFVLALNSEIRLLELNSSTHIKVYCFLFKINDLLHQFTSMEFTEVTMAIH